MTMKLSAILNSQNSGGSYVIITENRDPLTSDTASLGALWINEVTNRFFICVDATPANTVWEAGAGGEAVATDTRDPNSSDPGNLGSMWINTQTNKFFICTQETPGNTVWGTDTQITVLTNTIDPTPSNSGYPLGTIWINTTTKRLFFCLGNDSGNAYWKSSPEVLNMSIDPTMADYNYPLGTMWINASTYNQKTYFVLIDNTPNKAIWSKNETDVFWVTDPTITGSVVCECDETLYTYNASGSYSSIDEATSIEYHWSCTGGILTSTTGTSISLYFENEDKNSIQVLSCYAQDDLGYMSKVKEFPIQVRNVNLVDNLTLSTPNKIITNESSFFDVSVGYTGGDHTLNYFWESSYDNINWTALFFVNPNLKLSEAIIPTPGTTYVRCTVTNLGGSVTITSTSIPTINVVTDVNSTFLNTDLNTLENKMYHAYMVSPSVISVPTVVFNQDDRIIVNDNQDNVITVNNVVDVQMNMITDKVLLNNDYTSFVTTCTLMGNKILVAYNNSNSSSKGMIRVGTFNEDSISFGDPIQFNNDYSQYITLLPLVDNKIIVAYRDDGNNNLGGCKVGTVTGDEISFGAEYVFNSVDTDHISMCKVDDNKFVISYSDYGTGNLGTLVVGQVSGTTITFGTKQVYTNSSYFNSVTLIDTNKLAICYQDDTNSNYGTIVIAGVSGTNLVLGTPAVFNSNGYTNYIKVLKIDTNKIAISYQDVGMSGNGYTIIGNIVATTATFGAPQLFSNTGATWISSSFINDILFVSYKDGTNKGRMNFGSISGTVVTFNTDIVFNEYATDYISLYEFGNKMALVFKDGGDADKGKLMIYTPYRQELTLETETVTTDVDIVRLNTMFVLPIIAQQPTEVPFEKVEMRVQTVRNNKFNITKDAGKAVYTNYEIEPYVVGDRVLVQGSSDVYSVITQINRSVIAGTGVSVKGNEDVFNSVNTQQTAVTLLDEKYIVCAYRDNSSAGSVSLGEVKYDNVYFSNKLTFNIGDVNYVSIAKVSDTKAVICYKKVSNGSGNLLIVSLVDGTLSVGGVFQFNAGTTDHIDIAQLDTDKFIVSYQDVTDLNKGKCIIGTVTGMIPSFGSVIEFNVGNSTFTSVTALAATKVAIAYRDIDNGGRGAMVVGNVIGLNVTFGTPQVFYSGSATNIDMEKLSASKVVIKYTDYTNSNYGAAIVGVISGTNVVFGVSVYFNNNETWYSNVVTVKDDMFMVIYDNYIGTKCYSRVGTVTGSVIVLDAAVEINNSTTSHIDAVMINDKKIVVTYSDQGNNYNGTAQIVRRDIDLLRSEILINDTLPTTVSTMELLPYRIEASSGLIQSFDSTEYYYTDLNEIYTVLNAGTLLTSATILTTGSYFYSRVVAVNTDEFDKYITRIDIDFWTQP